MTYNHKEIEAFWQEYWAKHQTFKAQNDSFDYYECLNNINLDDVNYRLKEMFDENQMIMSIVNPKK